MIKRTALSSLSGLSVCLTVLTLLPEPAAAQASFLRGDANGDRTVSISDAHFILNYLFRGNPGPSCQKAADTDDNGALQITDPVRILNYLMLGGGMPCAPFPAEGNDPSSDGLGCGGHLSSRQRSRTSSFNETPRPGASGGWMAPSR